MEIPAHGLSEIATFAREQQPDGDIKRGQNYNWFWMGAVAGIALAGADSYRNMRSADASMNRTATWDPFGLQQKQAAYHRAYGKNEAIWGIFLTLYLLNGIGSLFPTFSSPPVAFTDHQANPATVATADPGLFQAGLNTQVSLQGCRPTATAARSVAIAGIDGDAGEPNTRRRCRPLFARPRIKTINAARCH